MKKLHWPLKNEKDQKISQKSDSRPINKFSFNKKVAKMPANTVSKNLSTLLSSKKDSVTLEIRKLKFFRHLKLHKFRKNC